MRVEGVDPAHMDGFGTFTSTSGEAVSLADLADDEAYINDKAAKELDAVVGDELRLFIDGELPTGLQFFGRPWDEFTLIGLAYAYEQATHHRRPPESTPPLE